MPLRGRRATLGRLAGQADRVDPGEGHEAMRRGDEVADGVGNRSLRPFVRTAMVLASVALAATACSSGSAVTSSTATGPSSAASGGIGGGGTGSGSGSGSSGSGTASGSRGSNTTGPSGTATTTTGVNHTQHRRRRRGGQEVEGGEGRNVRPDHHHRDPPLKQQFTADDTTFRSAMSSAQAGIVRLPATTTPQQVAGKLLPLLVAANAYQSQMVNLPWSSSVKPLAQSLTQNVGQLTAVLEQVQHPGVFFSVRQLRTALSEAISSVLAASSAVRAQL